MQSRQNVQSRLPALRGRNRSSSQPGNAALPRMQSLVVQRRQIGRIADLHFQRRCQRLHEVKLADGTDVLAEGCSLEQSIDDQGRAEVAQGDPGRPPRAVPEAKRPRTHQKKTAISTTASHLLRSTRGQASRAGSSVAAEPCAAAGRGTPCRRRCPPPAVPAPRGRASESRAARRPGSSASAPVRGARPRSPGRGQDQQNALQRRCGSAAISESGRASGAWSRSKRISAALAPAAARSGERASAHRGFDHFHRTATVVRSTPTAADRPMILAPT